LGFQVGIFFAIVWWRVREGFCYEPATLEDIADVFTELIGGFRNLVPGRWQETLEGIVQGGHRSAGEPVFDSIGVALLGDRSVNVEFL
jgi:hypothetical protein